METINPTENHRPCRVYITYEKYEDESQQKVTRDAVVAKQLCRRLEKEGVKAFCSPHIDTDEARQCMNEAEILIVVGTAEERLSSSWVRREYDLFRESVETCQKDRWRIVTCLMGITHDMLPEYLRGHRSFSANDKEELVDWVKKTLEIHASGRAKRCISDEEPSTDEAQGGAGIFSEAAEPMPESAEAYEDDEYRWEEDNSLSVQKEAPASAEVIPAPIVPPSMPQAPMPAAPAASNKVKVQKVNKVDFSVVAPEGAKAGGSSVIDVLIYTKSQRGIVKKALREAKEKAAEAARSVSSVSVRHGSRVTVVLSSDDVPIPEDRETLIWNGDALDMKFRFSVPEDCKKKRLDFACHILFDDIPISRLYFSIPVNAPKAVPVRFLRKDSRRAFVSYSHQDKQRVVDQLCAIQSVAPKLRFWMDSQSMSAGELWRPAIASAIKASDIFLLFWSASSKNSSEVRKEWEYALLLEKTKKRSRNGARFISPVPLDDPKQCPPPQELNDLHFGDPSFDQDISHINDIHFVVDKAKAKNIRFF